MDGIFNEIMQKFIAAGIENPRLETRLLIASVLGIESGKIYADIELNAKEAEAVRKMAAQRTAHKPLDKILGHREFYKADFVVNEDVLSPRPDTEILVEKALQYLPQDASDVLDLGTGSGCIIESILLEKKNLRGVAVDISAKALETARQNAEKCGIVERVKFVCADWFAADFAAEIGQEFDMIVTNPPYIPSLDIAELAPEVKDHDPRAALDGGADGFESYRRVAALAPDLLKEGGYILIEAGIGQAQEIAAVFAGYGLLPVEIAKDLGGIERCVILQK